MPLRPIKLGVRIISHFESKYKLFQDIGFFFWVKESMYKLFKWFIFKELKKKKVVPNSHYINLASQFLFIYLFLSLELGSNPV